jgi:hypothetical protein
MSIFAGLAEFIDQDRVRIVEEWEAFARTLLPEAGGMSVSALRDHADQILTAIINDMKSHQSAAEQAEKSKGRGSAQYLGEIGKLHAGLRIDRGFKLGQIVAEYRALRASVLRLWEREGTDPGGITRFNEAIDEALTEAVETFVKAAAHFRDQSLGILGHDLRNPLSSIVVGATLLMNSEALDDQSARTAMRILHSAKRMTRMIEDLLDLTRTRFGDQIPVVPTPLDLAPLCQEVIAEFEGHHSGELRFTATGDLHGEWDSDRIAQVLSNLLGNAIQHGDKSGPISVVTKDNGAEVLLEVHNSGAPIPENLLPTIFEPMVHHSKTGLGLGLYIASQVVLAHGGTLDVTSTDVNGTTFIVRLPRHVKH